MPNATAHKAGAAIAVGLAAAATSHNQSNTLEKSVAASALAYQLGTLPDLLEPATNPNHRQFFHSLTFLGMVGMGMYRIYKWEPENDIDKFLRFTLLVTGGAYASHLLMDSTTPKGLPYI